MEAREKDASHAVTENSNGREDDESLENKKGEHRNGKRPPGNPAGRSSFGQYR